MHLTNFSFLTFGTTTVATAAAAPWMGGVEERKATIELLSFCYFFLTKSTVF